MSQTMSFAAVGRAFLDKFLSNLNLPYYVSRSKKAVAWSDGRHLHQCELQAYSWPEGDTPTAPKCLRLAVNERDAFVGGSSLAKLAANHLRVPLETSVAGKFGYRLEWTVLEQELAAFAVWWPSLLRHRSDERVELTSPPFASETWGKDLSTVDYAWSDAAWEAHDAWSRARARPLGCPRSGADRSCLMIAA